MKFFLICCLLATFLIAINGSSAQEEISLRQPVVISMPEGVSFMLKAAQDAKFFIMVTKLDGIVSVSRLNLNGELPVQLEFTIDSSTQQNSVVMRDDPFLVYEDSDLDGIPDIKITPEGKFKLKSIIWEKIEVNDEKNEKGEK